MRANNGCLLALSSWAVSDTTAAETTGFPPGLVSGGTTHASDAVAMQAQSDLTLAYISAAGQLGGGDLTAQAWAASRSTPWALRVRSSTSRWGARSPPPVARRLRSPMVATRWSLLAGRQFGHPCHHHSVCGQHPRVHQDHHQYRREHCVRKCPGP